MIKMDSKAQLTVDIITKVAEGKIDIVNASRLLNKFRRTVERFLKKLGGTVVELIRIDFSSPASAAGLHLRTAQDTATTFAALLDNLVVESFTRVTGFTTSSVSENFYGFDGNEFDALELSFDVDPTGAAGINNLQFNTIPEPSSGLLVLVGWALLALRRPCGRLGKR
jgi:hypothetical protein